MIKTSRSTRTRAALVLLALLAGGGLPAAESSADVSIGGSQQTFSGNVTAIVAARTGVSARFVVCVDHLCSAKKLSPFVQAKLTLSFTATEAPPVTGIAGCGTSAGTTITLTTSAGQLSGAATLTADGINVAQSSFNLPVGAHSVSAGVCFD